MEVPQPVWGLMGGALAELVRWYGIRDELHKGWPSWATGGYWVITAVMVAAGGALVAMHQASGVGMNPVLAVNIGASAPTILSALLQSTPDVQAVEPSPPPR